MVEQERTQILVDRARQGERAAFDSLVERFRSRLADSVRGWSRFRLGPPIDVEDVLQETFVRAFRSLDRFQWHGDDAFFRWLCGIAKRAVSQAARDACAREQRRDSGSNAAVPAGGVTESQVLRRNERFDRLESSLERLRPEHREVILLSRIEGLTMAEIAEKTGRPLATVKYHLAAGLAELKKHFGDTESLHLPDRHLGAEGDRTDE